jgi:hypothetical protein
MTYPSLELITESYYVSGIVAEEFETPIGSQITRGLKLLNEVLARKRIDDATLPYYTQHDFVLEAGVETTFIENLTECELLTYKMGDFIYSMYNQSRRPYWGSPRPTNVETLPTYFTTDRVKGGMNISVRFSPQEDYTASLWGLFALNSVTLHQDLSIIFDEYYIAYIKYDLARLLCIQNSRPIPMDVLTEYHYYDKLIRNRSANIDLKNVCISTIGAKMTIGWGQINICPATVPVGWNRGW